MSASLDPDHISENLLHVREKMGVAARLSGRLPEDITLLAVTKTWPAPVIRSAMAAGLRSFGENRIQEAIEKIPQLGAGLDWHLIGHLQSNKIRKALPLFDCIHSIDSLDLARNVNRIAGELGRSPRIYLQVNIAEEGRKFGLSEEDVSSSLGEMLDLEHLELIGLMTITPFSSNPEDSRRHYVALRKLRDRLESNLGNRLPGLSMGMSNDYHVAIEEGATIVRVGSALFGPRLPKQAAPEVS